MKREGLLRLFWTLLICGVMTRSAQAQLTLTPTAAADGFKITTFANNFPEEPNNIAPAGPFGIVFPSSGGVLVSDSAGNVRLFPTDTDGQNAASAPIGQNYGVYNAVGLADLGGKIYMTGNSFNGGGVIQINANGTFNQNIFTGIGDTDGIVADPITGHLFVSNDVNNQILDVNPVTKTASVFLSNTGSDGLALTPDGKILYAAVDGTGVEGINTSTGQVVFSANVPLADGTALGTGSLAGNLFANTNSGNVWEINLTTGVETLIADGGSRGDFVTVDPNGTLLLTQSAEIDRLTAPTGGGFGGTPEPGAIALALASVSSVALLRRRRK